MSPGSTYSALNIFPIENGLLLKSNVERAPRRLYLSIVHGWPSANTGKCIHLPEKLKTAFMAGLKNPHTCNIPAVVSESSVRIFESSVVSRNFGTRLGCQDWAQTQLQKAARQITPVKVQVTG